jgi:hypothetical protein
MQEHPHLQKFGERLTEPKLWHLNRKSVAGGLALGLFIGFMPVVGQMFISAALAILFRVNLPIAFMAVWISNPLTIAPIFFFAYKLGAWILQVPVSEFEFAISWQWFCNEFVMIWQPFLLGCLVCGVVAALLGSLFVRIGWRLVVVRSWLQRRKNKQR